MVASSNATTTLVVGATGATGRWVTKLLLDQGHTVKVIVRSKEKMLSILDELSEGKSYGSKLVVTEASLLDLSDAELQEQVSGCDAVVSCLGHNLDMKGLWGHPRRLVTDVAKRMIDAISATSSSTEEAKKKFVLMGSDGVANPNGQDDKRTFMERCILFLLRNLIPPHADNEAAAAFMHSLGQESNVEWSVVRPVDLIDGPPTGKYELFDKPQGGLFGAGTATRSHVAQAMVELIVNKTKWDQYKFKMPVLHDIPTEKANTEL